MLSGDEYLGAVVHAPGIRPGARGLDPLGGYLKPSMIYFLNRNYVAVIH